MDWQEIAVVGAGTMGAGITADLLFHGYKNIWLIDISLSQLERARKDIAHALRFYPLIAPNLAKVDANEALQQVSFTTQLNKIHRCDAVIENITEKVTVKQDLYQKMDEICKPDTCFIANTSCISITAIAAFTSRMDQVIGIHFMNPAALKSTVELIAGVHTNQDTIQKAERFLSELGKSFVSVGDFPGFVSNRISHLFMNEAAFAVQDHLAEPAQIDKIFRECFGHKLGPLETADLIGLDVVPDSLDILFESYHDSKYRCCPLLRKMVSAGMLGKKSGKGFYCY